MLTPQDIQNKIFVKAVFGGYDITAVDDFLEEVMSDYAALYKENAVLKSKIKVLVDKVEEYRSTEDAMRMALLTAQKMGDELQAEAKAKSSAMLNDAEEELQKKLTGYQAAIATEEQKLQAAQARTESFVASARSLISGHIQYLADLEKLSASAPVSAPVAAPVVSSASAPVYEAPVYEASAHEAPAYTATAEEKEEEIAASIEAAVNPVEEPAGEETNDWEDDELDSRPKFDFNNLEFGMKNKKD